MVENATSASGCFPCAGLPDWQFGFMQWTCPYCGRKCSLNAVTGGPKEIVTNPAYMSSAALDSGAAAEEVKTKNSEPTTVDALDGIRRVIFLVSKWMPENSINCKAITLSQLRRTEADILSVQREMFRAHGELNTCSNAEGVHADIQIGRLNLELAARNRCIAAFQLFLSGLGYKNGELTEEAGKTYREQLQRLYRENFDLLGQQLERDRTLVADAVTCIKKAINSRRWLGENRGSYEWDDERYQKEFGAAIAELDEAIWPLDKIASDWSGCPKTAEAVAQARRDLQAELQEYERLIAELPLEAIYRLKAKQSKGTTDGSAH